MSSAILIGMGFVLLAAITQGIFFLPMAGVKKWPWSMSWLMFSFFGMLTFNWLLATSTLPNILAVYQAVPMHDLVTLVLFGFGWGLGAVLYGLAMERLGLALGYPIIMGLIASAGSIIPLVIFFPEALFTVRGAFITAGTLVVLLGIVICSKAGTLKSPGADKKAALNGLLLAISAGVLSCLPNIGMSFGHSVLAAAQSLGASESSASNAVWAIFFSAGFVVNAIYCLYLLIAKNESAAITGAPLISNLFLTALMGLLWIASFYLYGFGAARLGQLGPVIGWPLFIAGSIGVGNLVGFWRGEWRDAPAKAKTTLGMGMLVLFVAVGLIAAGSAFQ